MSKDTTGEGGVFHSVEHLELTENGDGIESVYIVVVDGIGRILGLDGGVTGGSTVNEKIVNCIQSLLTE